MPRIQYRIEIDENDATRKIERVLDIAERVAKRHKGSSSGGVSEPPPTTPKTGFDGRDSEKIVALLSESKELLEKILNETIYGFKNVFLGLGRAVTASTHTAPAPPPTPTAAPVAAVAPAPVVPPVAALASTAAPGLPNVSQILLAIHRKLSDLYNITYQYVALPQRTGYPYGKVPGGAAGNGPSGASAAPGRGGMASRLQSLSIAALSASTGGSAGMVGAAGGIAGAIVGGSAGAVVASLSALATAALNASEGLSQYNARLFASQMKLEFVTRGVIITMAEKLTPTLNSLFEELARLVVVSGDLVTNLISDLAPVLKLTIQALTRLAQGLDVVIKGLEVLIAWVELKTGGDVKNPSQVGMQWAAGNMIQAGQDINMLHRNLMTKPGYFDTREWRHGYGAGMSGTNLGMVSLAISQIAKKELPTANKDWQDPDKVKQIIMSGEFQNRYEKDIGKYIGTAVGVAYPDGVQSKANLQQKLDESKSELAKSFDKLYKPLSNIDDTTKQMLNKGYESSMWLLNALTKFGHTATELRPQSRPSIPNTVSELKPEGMPSLTPLNDVLGRMSKEGSLTPTGPIPFQMPTSGGFTSVPSYTRNIRVEPIPDPRKLDVSLANTAYQKALSSGDAAAMVDASARLSKAITGAMNAAVTSKDPAHAFFVNAQRSAAEADKTPNFPRPSPAAMTLKIADTVQVTADDENRIHEEFLMLREEVVRAIEGLYDARSMRMVLARHQFKP